MFLASDHPGVLNIKRILLTSLLPRINLTDLELINPGKSSMTTETVEKNERSNHAIQTQGR